MRFDADLECTSGDTRITLSGDDGTLVVSTNDVRAPWRLLWTPGMVGLGDLRSVGSRLAALGATVRVETEAGRLVVLGEKAEPQTLTRLLGAPDVQLGSVRTLVRSTGASRLLGAGAVAAGLLLVWRRRRS
jgi:hypothetical protein